MRHPTPESEPDFGLHGLLVPSSSRCPLDASVACSSSSAWQHQQNVPLQTCPSLAVVTKATPIYVRLSSKGSVICRTTSSWTPLSKRRAFLLTLVFVFLGSYGLLPLMYRGSLGPVATTIATSVYNSVVVVVNESGGYFSHLSGAATNRNDDELLSTLHYSDSGQPDQQQLLHADLLHRVRFLRTKRRLPQCIIVGVRKCGTRALLEFLNLHPQIVKATQEVHFFDEDSKYSLGLEWYRRKMPYSFSDQITVEKSPSYFVTEHVPQRIFAMNPDARLLLIVREPITRAVSDYTQIQANKQAKGKSYGAFETYALKPNGDVNVDYKALQISLYANFLRHWFEVFPRRQLHVVDGDRLVTDPLSEIRKIEEFLGLEHRVAKENFYFNKTKGFFCVRNDTTEKCLSEAKGRKHPRVADHVVEKLKRFYAPYNERFFEMVGQNFSWPRSDSRP